MKYYRTQEAHDTSVGLLYIDDVFKVDDDGREWVYNNGEWCPLNIIDMNTFRRLDHIYTVTEISEEQANKLVMMEELRK